MELHGLMFSSIEGIIRFIYLLLVTIAIIIGNILVIIAVSKFKKLRKTTNILLSSLAVADLMVGIVTVPLYIAWTLHPLEFDRYPFLCRAALLSSLLVVAASQINLILLSAERYIAVCAPFKHRRILICCPWLHKLLIFLTWAISLVTTGLASFAINSNYTVCNYYNAFNRWFLFFTVIFGIFIPFIAMIFMNIRVFLVVLKHEMSVVIIKSDHTDSIRAVSDSSDQEIRLSMYSRTDHRDERRPRAKDISCCSILKAKCWPFQEKNNAEENDEDHNSMNDDLLGLITEEHNSDNKETDQETKITPNTPSTRLESQFQWKSQTLVNGEAVSTKDCRIPIRDSGNESMPDSILLPQNNNPDIDKRGLDEKPNEHLKNLYQSFSDKSFDTKYEFGNMNVIATALANSVENMSRVKPVVNGRKKCSSLNSSPSKSLRQMGYIGVLPFCNTNSMPESDSKLSLLIRSMTTKDKNLSDVTQSLLEEQFLSTSDVDFLIQDDNNNRQVNNDVKQMQIDSRYEIPVCHINSPSVYKRIETVATPSNLRKYKVTTAKHTGIPSTQIPSSKSMDMLCYSSSWPLEQRTITQTDISNQSKVNNIAISLEKRLSELDYVVECDDLYTSVPLLSHSPDLQNSHTEVIKSDSNETQSNLYRYLIDQSLCKHHTASVNELNFDKNEDKKIGVKKCFSDDNILNQPAKSSLTCKQSAHTIFSYVTSGNSFSNSTDVDREFKPPTKEPSSDLPSTDIPSTSSLRQNPINHNLSPSILKKTSQFSLSFQIDGHASIPSTSLLNQPMKQEKKSSSFSSETNHQRRPSETSESDPFRYNQTDISKRRVRMGGNSGRVSVVRDGAPIPQSTYVSKKVARTVALVCFSFIVAWLPFFIVIIVNTFCANCQLIYFLNVVLMITFAQSASNPVIYALCHASFRNAYRNLFKHMYSKCIGCSKNRDEDFY